MKIFKLDIKFKGKSYVEVEAENRQDAKMKASEEYMKDNNITDIEITSFNFED